VCVGGSHITDGCERLQYAPDGLVDTADVYGLDFGGTGFGSLRTLFSQARVECAALAVISSLLGRGYWGVGRVSGSALHDGGGYW
jgi:hypothetical protein